MYKPSKKFEDTDALEDTGAFEGTGGLKSTEVFEGAGTLKDTGVPVVFVEVGVLFITADIEVFPLEDTIVCKGVGALEGTGAGAFKGTGALEGAGAGAPEIIITIALEGTGALEGAGAGALEGTGTP